MNAAIELKKDPYLSIHTNSMEIWYKYSTFTLEQKSDSFYRILDTNHDDCIIQISQKFFVPKNLYIVNAIHKFQNSGHTHEIIIEHWSVDNAQIKVFFCFALSTSGSTKTTEKTLSFPLRDLPLESLCEIYGENNVFYKSNSDKLVMFFTSPIPVFGIPLISQLAKESYREILDNERVDSLSHILTIFDTSSIRSIAIKSTNVPLRPLLIHTVRRKEGFETISGSYDYMECNLLKDDGTGTFDDTAIVPLSANIMDRSIAGLTYFLNFVLLIVVCGILIPVILDSFCWTNDFQKYLIPRENNPDFNIWYPRTFIMAPWTFILFFFVFLLLGFVGTTNKIHQRTYLYISFNFLVAYCFLMLGILIFKKIKYNNYPKMFEDLPDKVSWMGNLLAGIRDEYVK